MSESQQENSVFRLLKDFIYWNYQNKVENKSQEKYDKEMQYTIIQWIL